MRLKGRLARNDEMYMWKKGCCREKEIGVKRSRRKDTDNEGRLGRKDEMKEM